LSYTRIS